MTILIMYYLIFKMCDAVDFSNVMQKVNGVIHFEMEGVYATTLVSLVKHRGFYAKPAFISAEFGALIREY
jgi:hypothetical protein